MNNFWLKKLGWFAGIFLVLLVFNLNKSQIYESETDVLLLPKNEVIALNLDVTVENFQQILASLAFNDRLSDGSEALASGVDLPNYKRKDFWNSKLSVIRADKSGVLRIKNFDAKSSLAQELNNDTIENLIAVIGRYYNIQTDLEIQIIDGPIVRKTIAQNLTVLIGESLLWSLALYLIFFFLFPLIFIKKETGQRELPGRDFSRNVEPLKKMVVATIPEEDNYFATKNFFDQVKKTEVMEKILPKEGTLPPSIFPSFGKKAPTPVNLPVSEDELPSIFRQKIATPQAEKVIEKPIEHVEAAQVEYIPREATPEEVKSRLNRLLGGGK